MKPDKIKINAIKINARSPLTYNTNDINLYFSIHSLQL